MSVDAIAQEELWPEEEWRAVPGFEGFYQVSSLGRVMSLPRPYCRGRILKERLTPKGYVQVALSVNGKVTYHYVHRLVMAAFDKPCPEGMEVLHLDDNPRNNARANLAYDTHAVNQQMVVDHGRHAFASRDVCDKGHEYTPETTIIEYNPDGTFRKRVCGVCLSGWRKVSLDRARDLRQEALQAEPPIMLQCPQCPTVFQLPRELGQSRRRYCSKECQIEANRARAREASARKVRERRAQRERDAT